MTQPAASKLLKDLEDVLEVTLFERLPRGMRPTWYGETMIRHARMALTSLNQAHDELTALKAGHFGQVGIGAITSPGLALLPPAVAIVKQEHPSLRVSLDIETSPVLLERLEQGKLEILVARLFAEHDKTNLRYEPLTEEPVCAVARPGHPLLGITSLTLRDVVAAGWIVPPSGSVLRHRFELMFQEDGLAPTDQCDRDLGAAVHHAHAAAKRHGGRARRRRGALLRSTRHRLVVALGHAMPHGRLWHHHAHRPVALTGGQGHDEGAEDGELDLVWAQA